MSERVRAAARRLGLELEPRRLDASTRTVADAAAAVGCSAAEIAKSIVFLADGEPVVCIASGRHRIDSERLRAELDAAELRIASAAEVRAATGFAIGGVPPFGHGAAVVLDAELLRHERVWAAAGDPNSLFEVDPAELAGRLGARVASVGG